MERQAGAALQWIRASALAAVVLSCGTLAHISAAGRVPGPVFFLVIGAVTVAAGAFALSRPASVRRVVLLTVAGQTWVHLALTAAAGHAGDPTTTRPARSVPSGASSSELDVPGGGARTYLDVYEAARPDGAGEGMTVPSPFVHLAAELSGDQAPMMMLHLAAAALVGLWLAAGERALWSLLTALLGAHRVTLVPDLPVLRRPAARPTGVLVPRRQRLVARPALRRGPPALLLAA